MWLTHRLEEEFPGIVMPALPVKIMVRKFDQTFVEVGSLMIILVVTMSRLRRDHYDK